jgi:hypothetical protein
MTPVSTILQVGTFYNALGVSFLYEPLMPGDEPTRKTFVFLRDGNGDVLGGIFTDAEKLAGLIS